MTCEKFDDITQWDLVALVWIKDVQEVVNLFVELLFSFLITVVHEEINIDYVHSFIQINELIHRDDSVPVCVDIFEKIKEFAQKVDVILELVAQDCVQKNGEGDFWVQIVDMIGD